MDELMQLLHDLAHGNDTQKRAASYRLIGLKNPASVPVLIQAYKDSTDLSLRNNILEALKSIGTREAEDFLFPFLPTEKRKEIEERKHNEQEEEARIFTPHSNLHKWEYLTILCFEHQVIQAGAKSYAEIDTGGTFIKIKVLRHDLYPPSVDKFLNDIGQVGWEVVGVYVDESSGEYWRRVPIRIIAKRPIFD